MAELASASVRELVSKLATAYCATRRRSLRTRRIERLEPFGRIHNYVLLFSLR
jgi:hypothetical protein